MIQVRRVIGILTSIAILGAGAVVLQTRAADESHPSAAKLPLPGAGGIGSGGVGNGPGAGGIGSGGMRGGPGAPGAPQVPEESATIRDDPTIAPDPKQSADNNVSFPSDI